MRAFSSARKRSIEQIGVASANERRQMIRRFPAMF
jgi:hypothetical protein